MWAFRHIPTLNEQDTTKNFEQLQATIRDVGNILDPIETTKANTEAIKEILTILRSKNG